VAAAASVSEPGPAGCGGPNAIAASRAVDRHGCELPTTLTIDHCERLWDRARKIAPHHLRFFSKHRKRFCGTRNEGRFLSAAPWTVFLWNDPQARRRVNVAFGHYEDVRAVCSEEFLPKTFATAELDLANVYS
jgi:hypothetical protein